MESWKLKELFKGSTHKFSLAATYLGLKQRQGQHGLEVLEERLGTEALERELTEWLPAPLGQRAYCIPQMAAAFVLRQATPL